MTRDELKEKVARALALCASRRKQGWRDLSDEEKGWEIDNAWDLWTGEAEAALGAIEEAGMAALMPRPRNSPCAPSTSSPAA